MNRFLVVQTTGAMFFAAKDSISTAISNAFGDGYADLTTVAAVGLAQIPYWGIRSPAEFLKTRYHARSTRSHRSARVGFYPLDKP